MALDRLSCGFELNYLRVVAFLLFSLMFGSCSLHPHLFLPPSSVSFLSAEGQLGSGPPWLGSGVASAGLEGGGGVGGGVGEEEEANQEGVHQKTGNKCVFLKKKKINKKRKK